MDTQINRHRESNPEPIHRHVSPLFHYHLTPKLSSCPFLYQFSHSTLLYINTHTCSLNSSHLLKKKKMKLFFASLLVCSLLLSSSVLVPVLGGSTVDAGTCGRLCGERCKRAGVMDRCIKYCGICCRECKCVPSGTYGNKHECPCYRDKKNSKHKPKCP